MYILKPPAVTSLSVTS
uniref:Uncharacterized protein n=1 Tax=Anguilla anguilla TaxID=7936 RepID=A0A0E9SGR5_ANGAN